ncbi:hypothetical protein E6Q11_00400 [Candidatus Dojkabacteria bacterium]|uniref:Uncharacterized protein n=1 Tax=Candidatus Dojkabacteria bacterium TaxID=2099670 RepID=A0A5C7JCE8_9BACT|nr:MAG: hypothetical protein E6Q11_00400 [Candidatus Dojkabacteria bacterium]
MATTIGDATSRVRNVLKAVKEDPFLTDRFLYSLIMKYAKVLIRRQENEGKIYGHSALFKELPCVELIDVDRVEACCIGIKTGCTFKRTKDKLPTFLEGTYGPIIRAVTTIDQSQRLQFTHPTAYTNLSKSTYFKYNKQKYYWYLNGYIYVPNVEWEAIRIEAMFDESVEELLCSTDPGECVVEQERTIAVPDYLFAEIEQMVLQELYPSLKVPTDGADDSQNILR